MPDRQDPEANLAGRRVLPGEVARFNAPLILLYTLTHFVGDVYASYISPLLPLFQQRFGLSKTMCGALYGAQTSMISFCQPPLGFLADRLQTRSLLILGPVVSGVFFSLMGLAPSFWWLMALLMMGGLGVAAFHPSATALTARAAGPKRHLAVSILISGGILGAAVGYPLVVFLTQRFGLHRLGFSMIPALLLAPVLYFVVPRFRRSGMIPAPIPLRLSEIPKPVRVLFGIAFFRGFVGTAIPAFTPLLLADRGYPLSAGGTALSAYMVAGIIGNFLGGWMAEKVGTRAVIFWFLSLSFPCLVGFTLAKGPAYFPFLLASGLLLSASPPAEIVLAQRSMPEHTAAVSGVFTGLIWGAGGLSMIGAGAVADRLGTAQAMLMLWPLALIAALIALALPKPAHKSA